MLCLGIESSCDDTSLALVQDGVLLGQEIASQTSVHALFGGVVPEMASREHARYIGPLCDKLLAQHNIAASDIDVVAVARGPGLLGSLLVGVAFAKAFALGTNARLIGVNHLAAHLLAAGLEEDIPFPAVGLLVSGGHTHLYALHSPTELRLLGKTLDDAAGEAFDKAGKMLGLPYPAGKHIDGLAAKGRADNKLFPRPYLDNDTLDFSFSGLKTAMANYVAAHPELKVAFSAKTCEPSFSHGPEAKALEDACASYSLAIVDTLAAKTRKALAREASFGIKSLILAGGVAANSLLRAKMKEVAEEAGIELIVPSPSFCTDNGAMIAYAGWLLAAKGHYHAFDMEAIARGRRIPDDYLIATV